MSITAMKDGFINAMIRLKEIFVWAFEGFENMCSYIIVLMISILLSYKEMIAIICLLSVIDWFLAVINAIKENKLQSTKMLGLVGKLTLYGIGFLIAGSCKIFIGIDTLENMITATIFIGEIISILSNMILLCPNWPILRYLDKILKSEMASKTGQTVEEVEEMLKTKKSKK